MPDSIPILRDGKVLFAQGRVADGFLVRFLGLMGRPDIAAEAALVFPRCNSIHTLFMRFPIDVVLCDYKGEVVEVVAEMRPWRLLLPRKRVSHVIEMRAGRCAALGIAAGDRLICEGAWE